MGTGTERSNSLHNFTMPLELRWGNQKFLRCMKVNSNAQISPLNPLATNNSDHHHRNNSVQQPRTTRDAQRERKRGIDSPSHSLHGSRKLGRTSPPSSDTGRRFSDDDGGIAAMREKMMFDLQTETDKIKNKIFKDGLEEGEVSKLPPPPPLPPTATPLPSAEGELTRPWNLRTRRASSKTSASRLISVDAAVAAAAAGGGESQNAVVKSLLIDAPKPNSGLSLTKAGFPASADKSPRLRSGAGAAASGEKRVRAKFSVALSKKDIEEDFFSMVGHRPPRRPKKRAKIVQNYVDEVFPGLLLTEVTPDMYKVEEPAA